MADQEFDELKREFLSEARGKIKEIESALEGERDPSRIQRLSYLAHQLKGSGGSYGFQRISTDAAELEKAAELLSQGSDDVRLEEKMQVHVINIRSEIDRRERELAAN